MANCLRGSERTGNTALRSAIGLVNLQLQGEEAEAKKGKTVDHSILQGIHYSTHTTFHNSMCAFDMCGETNKHI